MWEPTHFWEKVEMTTDCWIWMGARSSDGYGVWGVRGTKKGAQRRWKAHRFSFQKLAGPIPIGLVLDHLCCNRLCVNPTHLEPVSNIENLRRGNHSRDFLGLK